MTDGLHDARTPQPQPVTRGLVTHTDSIRMYSSAGMHRKSHAAMVNVASLMLHHPYAVHGEHVLWKRVDPRARTICMLIGRAKAARVAGNTSCK